MCQIEVRENNFFYCRRVALCFTRTHTLTSSPLPWYSERIEWKKFSCLSLITRCQYSNSDRLSPDFRFEADWLKCAAPQILIALLASRLPLLHDPLPPFTPPTCNKRCCVYGRRQEFVECSEWTLTCRCEPL